MMMKTMMMWWFVVSVDRDDDNIDHGSDDDVGNSTRKLAIKYVHKWQHFYAVPKKTLGSVKR